MTQFFLHTLPVIFSMPYVVLYIPDSLGHRLLGSNAFAHVAVNIFLRPFCFVFKELLCAVSVSLDFPEVIYNPCSLFYHVRVPQERS